MKTKFTMPTRMYCEGDKKMVSMRLPEALIKELGKLSEEKGWSVTDLVTTVLDYYIQGERSERKAK